MGDEAVYGEEGLVHAVRLKTFRIDRHKVTNRQFAAFVRATGHVTRAERPPDAQEREAADIPGDGPQAMAGSAVFMPPARPSTDYVDWWRYVPGANWRKP